MNIIRALVAWLITSAARHGDNALADLGDEE